jgi:hypothetical protein
MSVKYFGMKIVLMLILFLFTSGLFSQQILVWDQDNNSDFMDPDGAGMVGCEYGLEQALQANNANFTTLNYLPNDLTQYDIIFVTLGIWCTG